MTYPRARLAPAAFCSLCVVQRAGAAPSPDTAEPPGRLPRRPGRARRHPQGRHAASWPISQEDGRFLRLLVSTNRHASGRSRSARASGYSAIWIGLGLRETGGRLVTIEYDPAARQGSRGQHRQGRPLRHRPVVPGDAFKEIPKLQGQFDFVFLDAWKRDYQRFFDMVFPRMPTRRRCSSRTTSSTSAARWATSCTTIETHPEPVHDDRGAVGEGVSVSVSEVATR